MTIISNDEQPIQRVRRVATRLLTGSGAHSKSTTVWQQWLDPGHFIPEHYHDVEEVLLILTGTMEVIIEGTPHIVASPATVVIAPHEVHSMRPHGAQQVQLFAIFPDGNPKIFATDGSLRPLPWQDTEA